MKLMTIRLQVTGISPILMHNPVGMETDTGSGKPSGRTRIPTPAEEAERGLYRLPNGRQLYIPSVAFRNGMLGASKGKRVKALKMTCYSVISGGVFSREERCPLVRASSDEPIVDKDEIDTRRAVIPSSGAAVMRSRALVRDWRCYLSLDIEREYLQVTPDFVLDMLNLAGAIKGVLDFRPECGGEFGRYVAELVEEEVVPVAADRRRTRAGV